MLEVEAEHTNYLDVHLSKGKIDKHGFSKKYKQNSDTSFTKKKQKNLVHF